MVRQGEADRCRFPVWAHIRDRNRNHGVFVCERHQDWGKQAIARLGYQPVVVLVKQGTKGQREITSGCMAPR